MERKKKICSECSEEKFIWKNHNGSKYCKECWSNLSLASKQSIKKKSIKREVQDKIYTVLRRKYLHEHPICEIRTQSCQVHATDIHHIYNGENRSQYYLDTSTWKSSCRVCHDFLHSNSKTARELGLLK